LPRHAHGHRQIEGAGNLSGKFGLSCSGLSFDQQRTLECNSGIDRNRQILRCDISVGTFKFHCLFKPCVNHFF
jgi:hypothetical protein